MTDMQKAALRGEPSYVWRRGQQRRLERMQYASGDRQFGRVLDDGCGIGTYLKRLAQHAAHAHGVELDHARAVQASQQDLSIAEAAGEALPFASHSFDLVLSHEVLEHVSDDRAALEEIVRILRKPDQTTGQAGGRLLLFVPNRGYPFETHGIFLRGNYRFGNIPLVNYLPRKLRDRLAPHVRVYGRKDLQRLIADLPVRIIERQMLFGAYDNIIARWPRMGRALRTLLQRLEDSPLRVLGLSHFWVLERLEDSDG